MKEVEVDMNVEMKGTEAKHHPFMKPLLNYYLNFGFNCIPFFCYLKCFILKTKFIMPYRHFVCVSYQ